MYLTLVPGSELQDRSCRIWHQGVFGRPHNPRARWILEAVCGLYLSFRFFGEVPTTCLGIWSIVGCRAWVTCSFLERCAEGLGLGLG